MKKVKIIYLIVSILLLGWILPVSASTSASIKTTPSQVLVGEPFKVIISIEDVLAWNLKVEPAGSIKGCFVEENGTSENNKLVSKKFEYSCYALSDGDIDINLTGTISNDNNSNTEILETVTISASPNPKFGNNVNTSSTAILKSLTVEGYEVSKVGDYKFYLTVPSTASKITISGEAENSTSTIKGLGEMTLKDGENQRSIIVTAEDNTSNEYQLIIIREKSSIIDNKEKSKNDNKSETENKVEDKNAFNIIFISIIGILFVVFLYLVIDRINNKKINNR